MGTNKKPLSVLLGDDDQAFCDFLRTLLRGAVRIVGETADGVEAVRLANELRPDIVLLDIDLPELDGITAGRLIKAGRPETKVVLLTSHDEDAYLSATGRSGADELVPKRKVRDLLLPVVRRLGGEVSPYIPRPWDGRERRGKGAPRGFSGWNGVERRRRPSPVGDGNEVA